MQVLKQTSFQIDGDLKALDRVLGYFDQLNQPWIPTEDWLQCQLALAEGFTNAVRHAHKSLPPETPIEVEIILYRQSLEIRIWDWGPPFDLKEFLQNLNQRGKKLSGHGQGLLILQKIAAHLSYTRTDDNRNCLLIVKEFFPSCLKMSDIQPVVSPEWLSSQLSNPQVTIVDCRFQLGNPDWGYQQYCISHLPGAYYLDLDRDLSAPVEKHGGRHPLPDPDLLSQKLSAIGITSGQTLVVAYDDSRLAFAARLWWLLRYLGHEAVAVLDGGWKGWTASNYPVTEEVPSPRAGRFIPQPQRDWTVPLDNLVKVCHDRPSALLVDARDPERYRGEYEPIDPIAGHIPGAVNCPWKQVTDERGFLRPLPVQKRLWADYQQAEEIIVYCGSGVTACVDLLSLKLAGIEKAKLYPGGWSDWCSHLS